MAPTVNQMLHAAVAAVLQHEVDASSDGHLQWDCAEHWRLSGRDELAIEVLRTCARRVFDIGRAEDSVATYKRALTLRAPARIRLAIIEDALNAIWSASNFLDAQGLLQQRRLVRAELDLPTQVHDSYEILEFAHVLHSGNDPRGNIQKLRNCIMSYFTAPLHRTMAAVQLLLIADLERDAALASFAFEATEQPVNGSFSEHLRRLVYESCFGNPERARHVANEIANSLHVFGLPNSPRLVAILHNIGYAYYRIGDGCLARRFLNDALDLSISNEMIAAQIQILNNLSFLSWHSEQCDECRAWHARLRQFESHAAFAPVAFDYYIIASRIALLDGRLEDATRSIRRAQSLPHALLSFPRMSLLTCDIGRRSANSEESCTDSELAELMAFHLRCRGYGEHDEIALVVLQALIARGRLFEAEELLNEYTAARRENSQTPHALRDIATQLSR